MTRNSIRKPSACQSINWSGGGQVWWPTIRTPAVASSSHGWNDANLMSVTRGPKILRGSLRGAKIGLLAGLCLALLNPVILVFGDIELNKTVGYTLLFLGFPL